MKKIRRWFYKQALKDVDIKKEIASNIKYECIAYNNWLGSCIRNGYPKKKNGKMMDNWDLYNYYINESDKRDIYIKHAKDYDK